MPLLARLKGLPLGVLAIEFTVVVLGILGALAVDSWWDGVQERKVESEYLLRLCSDLQLSRDSLVTDIALGRRRADSTRLVLNELRTGPNPGGAELLRKAIGLATYISIWFPFHTTYEELHSTGNLALITNEVLRADLGAYDRLVEDNADLDDFAEKWYLASIEPILLRSLIYSDVQPGWAERRDIPGSRFEEDFSSLYEDRLLWNALTMKLDLEETVLETRERALRELDIVLKLIEEELVARRLSSGGPPAS